MTRRNAVSSLASGQVTTNTAPPDISGVEVGDSVQGTISDVHKVNVLLNLESQRLYRRTITGEPENRRETGWPFGHLTKESESSRRRSTRDQ